MHSFVLSKVRKLLFPRVVTEFKAFQSTDQIEEIFEKRKSWSKQVKLISSCKILWKMPVKSILIDRNVVNYFVKMQTNSGAPCWVPRHRSDRDAIAFICFECQKAICVHFVSSCCPAALPCEILRIYKCLEPGIIICKNAPSSS